MKRLLLVIALLTILTGCKKEGQYTYEEIKTFKTWTQENPSKAPTSTPTAIPTPTENPLPPSVTEEPLECMEVITDHKYSDSELTTLLKCVEAEACDQDLIGKCLVARVILNRVESSEWGNTIKSVVYQKGQFDVVSNGSIDRVKVSAETREAIDMVLSGWDESQGAMYFRMKTKGRNEWHYTALEFLFDYGDHSFFK